MRLRSLKSQSRILRREYERLALAVFALAIALSTSVATPPSAFASAAKSEKAEKPSAAPLHTAKKCRWTEHESRLTSFATKIRSLEKEISDLIEHKKSLDQPEKVRLVTQQISFKHKDLSKAIRDYEEERLHVRFQHPDRDQEDERRYQAVRLKSLEEIEEAFGLDGRLDRLRQQVKIVYPIVVPQEPAKIRAPASVDEDDEKPERIRLVK